MYIRNSGEMSDFAKKYLIKESECHLGVDFIDNWDKYIDGLDNLDTFLNSEQSTIYVTIQQVNNIKKLKFTNEINGNTTEKIVIFSKNNRLTEENLISSLQITSVVGPPTVALYQTLNNVFTPLLKEKKIQKQIANLQADLKTVILSNSSNDLSKSTSIIESLEDEIDYWKTASKTSKNRLIRASSEDFIRILQPIVEEFNVIEAMPLNEVEEFLENSHGILDDLWRHEPPFPQERIVHLMDLIASGICRCVGKQLSSDIWTENYNQVAELLNQCIGLGEKWLETCRQLTEVFWPNYPNNAWRDAPYKPDDLQDFIDRLSEILTIQTLHRQLIRLLTVQEQDNLRTADMFKPYQDLDILEFGKLCRNQWLKARKEFECLLEPAEERVADKLKKQLSSLNANTQQLLYEFTRYSELISRPILRQTLLPERQFLLNSLYDYVKQLQTQLVENPGLNTRHDTPEIIAEIIVIRQLEAKTLQVQKTSGKLLNDLQGYENLKQIILELLQDLKQQNNELYENWTREISQQIHNGNLSLKETDPVVAFSDNKLMKVNYSPRLIILIQEVRQFKALGYHVPSNIEEITEHAKKFMKFARILEQIANFHNTIGDRMITCQRPMMLNSALALSKLVQEEEVVPWGDTKSVEKYVDNLKNAVEKLSKENNLLSSYHRQILDKIQSLENVDLIKDYSKWKEIIKQARNLIGQVEEKGFKNMQNWKLKLDEKLSECLEKQYVKSVENVHLYLPEIYTDIIYRNSQLQFSPNQEVLKEKYQQQLKKFLDIPRNFNGLSDTIEIFQKITETTNLTKVESHTNDLFKQLENCLKHWHSWLQLEQLDVNKLKMWQHWDLHFRASKTFGQEIAKLPSNEERIGCFLIGLTRLRSDLEAHNRSYWDQLVLSLKDSIVEDVVKLQNYVDPATAVLTRQPVTMEEIGETGMAHANIQKQAPEMNDCFNQMMLKSQTLSSWTREQVESVNRLKGAWERLQSLLENHQHIISKQLGTIRTTLNIEYENFQKEVERFAAKFELIKSKPGQISDNSMEELHKQLQNIKEKRKRWLEIEEKKEKFISDFNKFNFPLPDFQFCKEVEEDLGKEENFWLPFEQFYTDLEKIINEEWLVFRKKIFQFEDFLTNWQTKLKNQQNNDLVTKILQEIHKYEEVLPYLKYVKGEDFTDKHWLDVYNLLGMPLKSVDTLIFQDFLKVAPKISQFSKELQQICKKAASEIIVRQALAELDQWDVQARFILSSHLNSHNKTVMLVKDFKDILNKIGDNQSLLQSVKNSSDYETFSERANLWESKLVNLEENLVNLAQIQRKWLYLEPIFGSGTLIQEKARFEKTDKDFLHVLQFIEKDSRVSALCRYQNLNSLLKNLQEQLGRCQKNLDNFLQEKRNKFPRFLFLGDDDLLEVVGQSSKEHVIQTHLKKLFAGINRIKLDEQSGNIKAICSLQGEVVILSTPVNLNQNVEDWLNMLVKQMQITLKDLLVQCLNDGQGADPLKYPSQILCLADNITFTLKTEQAIGNMTLPPLLAFYKAQMSHYSSLELNFSDEFASLSETNDSTVLELKLKALLLDTIHHINILEELLKTNITKNTDWIWQKQLRFYSNSTGEVTVKMANARMDYSFEYLGNYQKLVRTPLTERCFLTMTQGMHLGMGGNPYGPAGTGKTESVKALGALLGRQVLVFNCDEGIDAAQMGRILTGLVKSGAWGCFDEFNRLDEATLSAVSMQIHPIQVALRQKSPKVTLLEQEIDINKHCGIFVTLNPAGGGYGGRNKLPDNLKQLFRPVLMMYPDHEQISRTLLYCDGYENADLIGRKLIEIFDLSSKLLSKQQHYDWGLRAIRTILISCGRALKQFKKQDESSENLLENELKIVLNCLKMDTMSKLTFKDSLKFTEILKDVFQHVKLEENFYDNQLLVKSLEDCCSELHLSINNRQINKCLELYEQLKQRMGVAVVGPASSGKTTIRKLLFHALNKMGKLVKEHVFNPKSMTKHELLGQIDQDTRQWNDGILTMYSLQVCAETAELWSWICCDGNIDPEWVESLNSVLDDNRLLTLPSGWRIQFGPNVNFIFETHDLTNASPATISRMGIVLLSDEDLNLNDYIRNFIQIIPNEQFGSLTSNYILKGVNWVFNEGELTLPCSKIAIAQTGLSQLEGVGTKSHLVVALINGLGQQLQEDFREVFAQQVFQWLDEIATPPIITKCRYNAERDTIDTYFTNPNLVIPENCTEIPLVLTGQICQTLDVLRVWFQINNEQHFLLVGPHGSAKSLILDYLVKERSDMELVTIYCSASLMPNFLKSKIAQYCMSVNTNRGKIYKPKKGFLVLYLKNLHLLKPDKWKTNNLIEFLHQFITYKAYFDSNLELVGYENIVIVGSLLSTNTISTRFTSILHYYNVTLPSQEDFSVIIVAYLSNILKILELNWPKSKIVKLTGTVLTIYDKIHNIFTINQFKHYIFSPHDPINWCFSILDYKSNIDPENIDKTLIEIFYYEGLKQFGLKLVNDDYNKLNAIFSETFKNQWNFTDLTLINTYFVPLGNCLVKLNKDEWTETVKKAIIQYEREGQNLDLLMNTEILDLCANLSKILHKNGGNVVLIGRSGIGRKSAVKIVSAQQSAKLIIPTTNKMPFFQNDLKQALQFAGLEDEQVFLVLEDQIFDNANILSLINILISSGEVPDLYNLMEYDSLVAGLKDEANRENFDGNLLEFFRERVKRKLHVIVCLDVANDNLWNIFENCPAFIHKSTIIWRTEWCQETIETLPNMLINQTKDIENCQSFPEIFRIIQEKMPAPCRYISMIKLYIEIYLEEKSKIITKQTKLEAGVKKLRETEELVINLKKKAAEQQEKLAEKQSKANLALDMISNTMRNANNHKEEMELLKTKTEEENQQLIIRKKEIEIELNEVEPLIKEARSAVGNIKTEALSEIRSLRAPPEIIRDILEGVLRLMGIQDTSWNSMKIFLAKRGVKEEIKSFDASRISCENRQAVERLLKNKPESFEQKTAKRASIAAVPLAAWVMANVKYSHVLDKIKPLEREQNKLKQNLANAESQLGELSAGLLDVDATVAQLKMQLSAYTKEAAEIEIDLNKAQDTLASAEGLVLKLNNEYERWQEQLKELSINYSKLSDFSCLSAAFCTYLSGENEKNRLKIQQKWLETLRIEQFDFDGFLSSERQHLQWQSEGLSYDKLSLENAIIILKSQIVPLLIDPTSRALNWLKNHFKYQQIECTNQNFRKFNTNLELAVRFGKMFVIEDIEMIPANLFPILRKEYVFQGERKLINLNGKLIDYHNDFKLILTNRNEFYQLPAEFSSYICPINFSVTHSGLTEQLLTSAIRQENPELENRRKQLLKQKEELQEKQYQLQNQLLEDLANASGDILQNSNLLTSLNETKTSSIAIAQALEESIQVQEKLQLEYNVYKEISEFGSRLYFSTNEFAKFNNLYVLSVEACIRLFLNSLQTFQGLSSTSDSQKKQLLHTIYIYMTRGIFKTDRLMYAMHLTQKLYPNPSEEWMLFLGNTIPKNDPLDIPAWIPKQSVLNMQNLQSLPAFYDKLQLNQSNFWIEFMNSPNCDFPEHCRSLTDFEKLILIHILRPECALTAMKQFVGKRTGLKSIDPPIFDLYQIFKESNAKEPILVLTNAGTDPSNEIRDLAQNLIGDNYSEVAMGEGQEQNALEALQKAANTGNWLILKNLHLVPNWLVILTQNLPQTPNQNFRLWLITEPNMNFSLVLAQNSLKVVYEPPQGLRNNLQRTFTSFGSKYVEKLNAVPAKIFFVLSCIHGVLQERRTYIPQGWSKFYEFNDTDLGTWVKLMEDLWQNQTMVQWKFIEGLCSEAIYGGKIENCHDREILQSYLRQFLNDNCLSHRWNPFDLSQITLPNTSKFEDFLQVIQKFPDKDQPTFFGLPENINRTLEKQTSLEIVVKLKNLAITTEKSVKFQRDFWSKSLNPFMNLWKKLNAGHDFIRMNPPENTGNSPLESFLIEDFTNALLLIQRIHQNFMYLNRVLKGTVLPDENTYRIGNDLLNHQVPESWREIWEGPKDPFKYLRSVLVKTANLFKMIREKVNFFQKGVNLSHFFTPNAFLACFKQEFARQTNTAIDNLMLVSNWHQSTTIFLVLTDLLLEGGLFDGYDLKPCLAQSENINGAPNCFITWKEKKIDDQEKLLNVPVYYTSNREKQLGNFQIHCQDKDFWIQAGLAFYLEY